MWILVVVFWAAVAVSDHFNARWWMATVYGIPVWAILLFLGVWSAHASVASLGRAVQSEIDNLRR